jgi:hypothetical protein
MKMRGWTNVRNGGWGGTSRGLGGGVRSKRWRKKRKKREIRLMGLFMSRAYPTHSLPALGILTSNFQVSRLGTLLLNT